MTFEPGLDLHEWETRWAELQEVAAEDPVAAIPEITRFVRQLLEERRYRLDEPITAEGNDADVVRDFHAAREVADRVDAAQDVDPEDVSVALENLREIYESLLGNRPPP
jgi:hypothetical protein